MCVYVFFLCRVRRRILSIYREIFLLLINYISGPPLQRLKTKRKSFFDKFFVSESTHFMVISASFFLCLQCPSNHFLHLSFFFFFFRSMFDWCQSFRSLLPIVSKAGSTVREYFRVMQYESIPLSHCNQFHGLTDSFPLYLLLLIVSHESIVLLPIVSKPIL